MEDWSFRGLESNVISVELMGEGFLVAPVILHNR